MKSETTRAFVLRLIPYGDNDRVVELLTRRLGRVAALARGARRSRRRFGGVLDYFHLLDVRLRRGRAGMWRLEDVDLVRSFQAAGRSLEAHACAAHALEVARLGTREADPDPGMFRLLEALFPALAGERGDPGCLRRVFQVRALAALGYALPVEACPVCGRDPVEAGARVQGTSLRCVPCSGGSGRELSPGALRTLRAAAAAPEDRLGAVRVTARVEAEIGPLLEGALCEALGARPRTLEPAAPIDPLSETLLT